MLRRLLVVWLVAWMLALPASAGTTYGVDLWPRGHHESTFLRSNGTSVSAPNATTGLDPTRRSQDESAKEGLISTMVSGGLSFFTVGLPFGWEPDDSGLRAWPFGSPAPKGRRARSPR